MQQVNAAQGRAVDKEWMKQFEKEKTAILEDKTREESIIIYAIKSLGSIKDRSPSDIEKLVAEGKISIDVSQLSERMINIIKKIREAITVLRNDEETLISLYRQIPYSIEKKIGDERLLRQIKSDVKEITKRLDDYREYWEENKKESKITGGFFSEDKRRKIQDSFLRILHEDDKISKEMLRVISDIYTKQSLLAWH